MEVYGTKKWWQSEVIWAGVAALAAGLLGVYGYAVSAEEASNIRELLLSLVSGVAGFFAIRGRVKATKAIT